ncbi:hypothetical protein AALO_G00207320 [Alosa alosa]|uniref:Homeobox domain-containing protein n=1 Tax=Alosa alosa TaxID=278164 RepID=A0AAV6G3E8_9TELE|nr:hypothetical protein AALO_G00207320 [Alosa alosa]
MVAMYAPELDTYSITKKVRSVRLVRRSVSTCWRCLPWSKLEPEGARTVRDAAIHRISLFNVDKGSRTARRLKAYLKRRHSCVSERPVLDGILRGPDRAVAVTVATPGGGVLLKRPRVVLGAAEKEALKRAYQERPYPSPKTIEQLANQLNLKISTVINWFHNYRSRIRRELFIEEIQADSGGRAKPGEVVVCDGTKENRCAGTVLDQSGRPLSEEEGHEHTHTHSGRSLEFFSFSETTAPSAARLPSDSSLRKMKAANLNNIIHRLEKEKAAGHEDSLDHTHTHTHTHTHLTPKALQPCSHSSGKPKLRSSGSSAPGVCP